MAFWLPQTARSIALLQPSLQTFEMIRTGMLSDSVPTYGDPAYATVVLAVLTLFGQIFTRSVRSHIDIS